MPREAELRASLKANKKKLSARAKAYRAARAQYDAARAKVIKRRRQLRESADPGAKALSFALSVVGRTEQDNRAPWLDAWARRYVGGWMVGQPWCGLYCIVAWAAAGKALPKDTVSTVAILGRARRGDGFAAVKPEQARAGDLVVMDFSPAPPEAMHVGLARGPLRNGVIPTAEGNTSPGSGGSQNNGGGIYLRTRPRGVVRIVARPK
jgi:hypothetical protein